MGGTLTAQQFAAELDISMPTFRKLRRKGIIPPPLDASTRKPLWLQSQVEQFLASGRWPESSGKEDA